MFMFLPILLLLFVLHLILVGLALLRFYLFFSHSRHLLLSKVRWFSFELLTCYRVPLHIRNAVENYSEYILRCDEPSLWSYINNR